jgi:hypothetical protein
VKELTKREMRERGVEVHEILKVGEIFGDQMEDICAQKRQITRARVRHAAKTKRTTQLHNGAPGRVCRKWWGSLVYSYGTVLVREGGGGYWYSVINSSETAAGVNTPRSVKSRVMYSAGVKSMFGLWEVRADGSVGEE